MAINESFIKQKSWTDLLRYIGGAAIVAALSMFLLDGWSEGNDVQRYLKLLMQTSMLGVLAFLISKYLKDSGGARLLFGLCLLSVTANFTILGALIYSGIQWDNAATQYPDAVTWVITDTANLLLVVVPAMAFLSLITLFCFRVFSPLNSTALGTVFLALNALLMLPLRNSVAVLSMAAAMLLLICLMRKKINLKTLANPLATKESRFALLCLAAPLMILITRAISLYSIDQFLSLTLSALLFFSLRAWLAWGRTNAMLSPLILIANYLLGLYIAVQLGLLFAPHWWFAILIGSLSSVFISWLQTTSLTGVKEKVILMRTHAQVLGVISLPCCFGLFYTLIPLLSFSVIALYFAYLYNKHPEEKQQVQSALIWVGGLGLFYTLALFYNGVDMLDLSRWALFSIIGIILIIFASIADRLRSKINHDTLTSDH